MNTPNQFGLPNSLSRLFHVIFGGLTVGGGAIIVGDIWCILVVAKNIVNVLAKKTIFTLSLLSFFVGLCCRSDACSITIKSSAVIVVCDFFVVVPLLF